MSATAHYETDFYLWTQQQAALLRQGEFNGLDLDCANIAEEIESMGRRDRLSLRSYLHNILLHLLKWRYQPERRGTSWKLSIRKRTTPSPESDEGKSQSETTTGGNSGRRIPRRP